MDVALQKSDVVPQLWNAYEKTKEYKEGMRSAIPKHHAIVENQEREGLKDIYQQQIKILSESSLARSALEKRTVKEWLDEWKEMHHFLFRHILKECGDWRQIPVRFGDPADEELYRIPSHIDVPREMNILAYTMPEYLNARSKDRGSKYQALAQMHYQFVRVHPFVDGNGRISRAITDQVARYFGFPSAMAGYPRSDSKRRLAYHKAIRACVDEPECQRLSLWIGGYIDEQLDKLA